MKLKIIRVICVLLIVGGLGLYVYGIAVKGDSPTENLGRTGIAVLSGVSALIKLRSTRRPLETYGRHFAADLGSAFEQDPAMREKLLEAVRLYDESKWAKALKLLDELRQESRTKDEHNAVGLFTALCQSEMGMNEVAAATYEETIRNGGGTSRIYSNLGYHYAELGDAEKAVAAYARASEMDPQNPMPYSNLANYLIRDGQYEEAEKAARRALQLNPKLYQASGVIAMVCAVQGRTEEQKKYFDMAVADGQDAETLSKACSFYSAREKIREEAENA